MEPRAATPRRRFDAMRDLTAAGVPTSVMVAPIIPALNDSEIERILEAAHAAGAREAGGGERVDLVLAGGDHHVPIDVAEVGLPLGLAPERLDGWTAGEEHRIGAMTMRPQSHHRRVSEAGDLAPAHTRKHRTGIEDLHFGMLTKHIRHDLGGLGQVR